MADDSAGGRRRRRRATAVQGTPAAAETAPPVANPSKAQPRRPRPARDNGERGMRDLVGAGPSQLGVSGALRGRDVNRPSDSDLAEAAETLVIVRRNWQPND